ncbi:MAG TPA: hypothetical protein PK675_04330 [Clostridia bacterium]|nr:hypothetical protein [Clostridia bacterium]
MGKIFLAVLIILALIFAMPVNLASALNIDGKYNAYYIDEMGDIQEISLEANEAKDDKNAYAYLFVTSDQNYESIVSALNFVETYSQILDDETILYGYSNRVSGGIRLNGRLVNIQIASKNGKLYIGSPLIVGWY